MKKTGSKETKAALKSISQSKKKTPAKKSNGIGRGGARAGAGRKPKYGAFQQLHIDTPTDIIEAMDAAGITNRTAFVIYLLAVELKETDNIKLPLQLKLQSYADVLKNAFR